MRILVTTGLSPRDIGGPFQYAPRLTDEFLAMGHEVKVSAYGRVEKLLPVGLRHLYFFLKIMPACLWADRVLTLDTFSVGIPSVLASKLFGKKIVVRIGGDFLWESYIQRTGDKITLGQFNSNIPRLSTKEKIIFYFTKFLAHAADTLAFNTEWQKNIWQKLYGISPAKISVIRNYVPDQNINNSNNSSFLWAGRKIKLKNIELLKELSGEFKIEMFSGLPHRELQEKIKNCYAVILPSYSEVSPNFILEAASFGKPFIMTRETGLKEIYNQGGIFIDPFDKNALKEAILSMLDDAKYNKFKEELKHLKPRSWRQVAEEFLSLCQ